MKFIAPKAVIDILLPRRCMLCTDDIDAGYLCLACYSLCHPCPPGPFSFIPESVGAIFYYELAVRDTIKWAKFRRSLAHARVLFDLLKKALPNNELMDRLYEFSPTGVTYVPTHWARRALRGLDLPSMFAQVIARELKAPLIRTLHKKRLGGPQSSLQSKSARLQAVKGLFKLRRGVDHQERLLLVDDIVTTGATFDECRKVLYTISKDIRCLAIARTP